ncbi:hypothetical protein [Sulfobacillus thermosulfidooxidans]|uniref:hypothetical protein n=1 Tax=Sulfobacillus thermosulfidooxidans TaxID=28034 RepID=UPI000314F761|nr:hypothetical protein [Sulfobacillus thermosulfidooxidans]
MIGVVVGVAVLMVVVHEMAHVLTALAVGGRWDGLAWRWWAVGVRLRVDGLRPRQVAATLWAAPLAEAVLLASAVVLWPHAWRWWGALAAGQWLVNLMPWPGWPNDGAQLWRLWVGHAAVQPGSSASRGGE